ncbi:MAG: hypothetical protein US58_C0011G0004 [Candidatus Magasanikbacteria bacterium GW2011_GWA2_37_8]|uniref:Uncharacterized protein n=1 Tax=Candidatus Magasanikbacteria bacterium GW2011_GWA2_37_8 TaxID=1619036 RepID=A0A0G0HF86_9BACT|nr:MAG: hypothetical protein US58_C0011G0004 [Candidatus Magasanikbacteria bacterium GW2011_GWA2_37_8]
MKRIFFLSLVLFFILLGVAPAMAKPYKNYLSQKDWTKYGVNPWRIDTDFDGYTDDWEVKHSYCPTAGYGVRLSDSLCEKGKFDLRKGVYTAPAEVKAIAPREWTSFNSCTSLVNNLNSAITSWQAKTATARAEVASNNNTAVNLTNNLNYYLNNFYSKTSSPFKDGIYFSANNTFYIKNNMLDVWQKTKTSDKHLWQYSFSNDISLGESRLVGNKLIVFASKPVTLSSSGSDVGYISRHTIVYEWNINNLTKSAPAFVYEFSGELEDWSIVQNNLYLSLNNQFVYKNTATGFKQPSEFLPTFSTNGKKVGFNSKDCLAVQAIDWKNNVWPEINSNEHYLQLVSLSLTNRKLLQQKFVFDSSAKAVFAGDRAYVFSFKPTGTYNVVTEAYEDGLTEINQFNLQNGKFNFVNNQTINGVVLNYSNVLRQGNNLWVATNDVLGVDSFTNKLYLLDASLNKIGWYNDFGREGKAMGVRLVGKELRFVFAKSEVDSSFYELLPGREFGFDITNPRAPAYLGVVNYAETAQLFYPLNNNEVVTVGLTMFNTSTVVGDKEGIKLSWWQEQFPGSNVELFTTTLGSRGSLVNRAALSPDKKYLALSMWLTASGSTSFLSDPVFYGVMVYKLDRNEGFAFVGSVKPEDYAVDTMSDFYFKGNQLIIVGGKTEEVDTGDSTQIKMINRRNLFWFNLSDLAFAKKTIE